MTTTRWLAVLAVITAAYIASLLSSRHNDQWAIPPQVNSVILTTFAVAVVCMVLDARADARARPLLARLAAIERMLAAAAPEAPTTPLRAVGTVHASAAVDAAFPALVLSEPERVPADNVLAFELGRAAERDAGRARN